MQTKIAFAATAALILLSPVLAAASSVTMELSPGMSGSDVSALQTFLAADSTIYPEGIVSGFYGPLTTLAVKRYQTSVGISPVGRVGPVTLASINGVGGTNDINASITTAISVTPAVNSALVEWKSNEPVFGRVMYATVWPFVYGVAPSVSSTSGFNSSQAVNLNGLQTNTTYYFVLESEDVAGNTTYTIGNTFRTK